MAGEQPEPERHEPGVLSSLFGFVVKTAIATAVAIPLVGEGLPFVSDMYRQGGEPITAGEAALIHSVFGDQIDTTGLTKHLQPYHSSMAASVGGGSNRHIDFWGETYYSNDFSKENGWLRELFMHEVTHIWQNQNNNTIVEAVLNGCKIYDYELTAESTFDDFCVEQQAEIVADYVGDILYPGFGLGVPGAQTEWERNLVRVVEEQFPQARITREKLETEHKERLYKSASYSVFAALSR